MRKIFRMIILLIIIYFPCKASAASINISCPSSVIVGDTIKCTITGHNDTISGLKASVSFSGMNYVSVKNLTNSPMFVATKNGLDGVFDIAKGSISLARYNFKANKVGTAKISITCNEIIDGEAFDSHSCTGQSKKITIKSKPVVEENKPAKDTNKKLSSDASLKSIELSVGKIDLKKDTYKYELEVENNISNIKVNAYTNHNKATVENKENVNLKIGSNEIKIKVTAEDKKTTNTYTLNILRKEDNSISTNNNLKNITIDNYCINFSQDKKEYTLNIDDENTLNIKVELDDQRSKYEIIGNNNLKNGSIIKIKVTSEDNNVNTYTINIIKKQDIIDYLGICSIISILLNVVVLGILIGIIIKRKTNKTKN